MGDLKNDLASLKIEREAPPGRSPWRWPLLLSLPLVLVLGAFFALRLDSGSSPPLVETVRPQRAGADTTTPAGSTVLTASGYIVARRQAVVSAKIQGRLADLRVEEGDRIARGEIIARLESDDYAAQVRRAEAQLLRAEADLAELLRRRKLIEQLAKERVISADELEAARSQERIGEAALALAQADLELNQALFSNTLIRAPFTGTILKKMAEVGESVAPIPPGVNISTASGAIVALADLDTLEVEVDVSESNVAKLLGEQPAEVIVEAFPDRRYAAVLRQILPTADRTKATVLVKVTILDKDEHLKPEMGARVSFLEPASAATESPSAETGAGTDAPEEILTVPNETVTTRDGNTVVFEVKDGVARQLLVAIGTRGAARVAIRDGLEGNERLVARPAETLHDGDPVDVEG